MPIFRAMTFSAHALLRMRERRISREDVAFVLDHGEGTFEEDGTWFFDLGTIRVVVVDWGDIAHVVTVLKLRKHT